ncbi:glycine betaine/proline transport system ATP-binding protein [Rhodoligotrophos appendicifer]|uniref:quaternary amine ABC transporter ATP-binding protein n=1 Tax=Rhodoligotrophos appendicifer TaxID=987056 RepID=UPI001FED2475|nr:betaine/proline/choline family ABC transporter ATP-binding protein [Rhodoligotrophos appendicifer]
MLQEGRDKDAVFEATGQSVGVQDVSFEVEEGHIFVVMGLSGSGKSTLIRMINGLIRPTAGVIAIDGADISRATAEDLRAVRREKVAMVFQHFALFPHKTVVENVAFGLKIKGVSSAEQRARALTVLEQVGLAERADRYPDELSGGMQQRVGLARGLASDPQILLMDEPFGALDPLIRSDMQEELLELQRRLKKTIVFITHDLHEALTLGDRIAIMRNGRFVQVGSAEEIVGSPADGYVSAFTSDIDRSRVFTAASVATPATMVELSSTGPHEAISVMEEKALDALHVTDAGRVVGLVTYRDAIAAARSGHVSLDEHVTANWPTSAPHAHLNTLYSVAGRGLPILLKDDDGLPAGVVAPKAVFAKLAGEA